MYLEDPWTLPSLSTSNKDPRPSKMEISLFIMKVAYQVVLDPIVDMGPSSLQMEEENVFALPAWEVALSRSHDCLDDVFTLDEVILKAMNGIEQPWKELHHHA